MFKKLLATALLVCTIPAMASAWTLTTHVMSAGGSISSPNMALQTSVDGPISKAGYSAAVTPTFALDGGYVISKIAKDGVVVYNPFVLGGITVMPSLTVGSAVEADATLEVTFRPDATASVNKATASVAAGNGTVIGAVNGTATVPVITGNGIGVNAGLVVLAQPLVFQFKPAKGNTVLAIAGRPAAAVTVPALASARVNQIVTVTIPAGTLMSDLTAGGVVLSGTFTAQAQSIIAYAGPQKSVVAPPLPASFTLTGQSLGAPGAFSKWSSVSRPAGVAPIAIQNTAVANYTVPAAGQYIFQYRIANPTTANAGQQIASVVAVTVGTQAEVVSNCVTCHSANNIGPAVEADWNIGHKTKAALCADCHNGAGSGGHPGVLQCAPCHAPVVAHTKGLSCNKCHSAQSAHTAKAGCVDCHSVGLNAGTAFVQDNSGVRSIMNEFTKRSHHITGGTPTNAQCAVCHLEGQVVAGAVVVNPAKHMADNKIHLRNADDNTDYVWSGTEHSDMDNFCFSCHDNNGFSGAAASLLPTVSALITATNPFGDTLTNGYDLVTRAGVVDVKTAFTTTNASHHAVSGQRYVFKFSTVANATTWAARTGKPMPANSEIAELNAGAASTQGGTIDAFANEPYDVAGQHEGGAATLYEADKFVYSYIPLGATASVADNSLLHCGDCHTVGQWKANSSTSADGSATTVVIGAHGSANDYLLRNSLGTDAVHSSQTYVCFNCHKGGQAAAFEATNDAAQGNGPQILAANQALLDALYAEGFITLAQKNAPPTWKAGWNAAHPNVIAGQVSGYATAHAVSAFHAQCVADSSIQVGATNRLGKQTGGGHKDRVLDFVPAAGATAAVPSTLADSGNITGIGCTSCHNSGLRSGWGGIHGGNNTYTDGLGRTQKTYRFMPGMGNYRYAPPGGWDGENVSDPSLVTMAGAGVGAGKPMGGCYTNSAPGAGDDNPGFSTCSHHGTSTAQTTAGGQAAGFRATYGGGTTSTPTAAEPTVREATAGNSLVTRPLKY